MMLMPPPTSGGQSGALVAEPAGTLQLELTCNFLAIVSLPFVIGNAESVPYCGKRRACGCVVRFDSAYSPLASHAHALRAYAAMQKPVRLSSRNAAGLNFCSDFST